jgi:transposase
MPLMSVRFLSPDYVMLQMESEFSLLGVSCNLSRGVGDEDEAKQYSGEERVTILRKHLLDGVAISDLCDDYGLHPNGFYRWQKVFFEGGGNRF